MTLVEAMRCGLPVVSTDCPVGPREILRHGEDGFLVPNGEVDGIVWGLRSLMADENLRRDMGEAALRNSARYDPTAVADRYVRLFEDAARRRAAANRGYRAPATPRQKGTAQATVPPTSMSAAVVDVGVDEGGRLGLSAEGPDEGRRRWEFVLQHKRAGGPGRPEIYLRTAQEALSNGGTRYSAVVSTEALDDLGDGRWQVTMRSGKSRLVHMKAGLRDTRALIDARARIVTQAGSSRTEWNLPYAQPNGKLMLRTVVRQEHVECTRVEVTDTGIRLEGVLCGDSLLREGALFVLSRRGLHRAVVHVPVEIFGNRRFRADVPVRHAADQRLTRWEDWDWWLQPDPADRQKFRVCHLLEDFPDVKSVYAYKSLPLMGDTASEYAVIHPARPVWVRPYCSASGAMAMNVVDR